MADDVLSPEDEELVAELVATTGVSEVLAREIIAGHTCITPQPDEAATA